ncbi:MAG: cob(I)yrinic acid a,c-diamide adenosyltransferase [Gammaproteobacteria bacterium]|nr:cob(I)yrinic acid a,c-diamide adenosyltransferase [Gammaproteobacteria bacterium]MCP5140409.1 cob(I)yrinic acid a,c-diamide adenosyltransferase [Chromatiales bacterium]
MGNRLTKIYTRTGDDGTTGLGTGERVRKDCARVEAYGTVDELNSCIGIVLASPDLPASVSDSLQAIQHRLFDLGGELAVPGRNVILAADTTDLEILLDTLNADLPPLKDFILPGGTAAAANCHLARAVCRRAERRLLSLQQAEAINAEALRYLNRLSDLLFVMSRVLCRTSGGTEVIWKARGK